MSKLAGFSSILEMHGSTAGTLIFRPLLGLVGTIALSSAKRALAVRLIRRDSHVIPTCRCAMKVSSRFSNVET